MYSYNATTVRVVDADTAVFDVDLGFKIRHQIIGRFDGINGPELHTPAGKLAQIALAGLIGGKSLRVDTIKDRSEKFGRMLVVVFLEDGVTTANQAMIDMGHAVPYSGGRRA